MSCESCESPQTVTLHDGRTVCNTCEDWRHECEARHVCAIQSKERRKEYLDGVEQRRGKPSADRLRNLVMTLWQQR